MRVLMKLAQTIALLSTQNNEMYTKDKILALFCTLQLLAAVLASSARQQSLRNVRSISDGRSFDAGCCFVDLFCYVGCSRFVEGYSSSYIQYVANRRHELETHPWSENRRHGHRHRHKTTSFRSKRSTGDNVLWRKLRYCC